MFPPRSFQPRRGPRIRETVNEAIRGREIAHTDLGKKLLLRFAGDLAGIGTIEGQPKLEGRNAHVIISPVKTEKPAVKKEPKAPAEGGGAPSNGAPPA